MKINNEITEVNSLQENTQVETTKMINEEKDDKDMSGMVNVTDEHDAVMNEGSRTDGKEEKTMLKPLDWKTTSYEYKDGFIFDVIERETEDGLLYNVFLSHIDYKGRMHLFDSSKKDLEKEGINDWDGLSRQILNDIDEYIEIFCSDVMDREDLTEEDDYYDDMEWCIYPRGLMILDGRRAISLIADEYASKYSLVHPESIEKVKEVYDAHYSDIVGKTFEEELEDLEWDDEMELCIEDFDYIQEDIALYLIRKLKEGSEWNYWRNLISELGIADAILDECFLRFERWK